MKRSLKKILRVCAFVAGGAALLTAAAVVVLLLDKPVVRKAAEKYLARKTGVSLTIGRLDYGLFPLRIEATAVRISEATPVYSFEIAADRLSLQGDIRKLLRGERPALETAEAVISEIRVSQTKVSPVPIDFPGLVLRTADILRASRRTSLRCGRLIVLLLSQDFRLDNAVLTFAPGRSADLFGVNMSSERIAVATDGGRISFGSRLDADGDLSLGRTAGVDLRLALIGPEINVAGKAASAKNLKMDIQGTWLPDKGIFRFPSVGLDIPGLASLTGTLDVVSGSPPLIEAEAKAAIEDLGALVCTAGPFLPAVLGAVRLQGKADLEGRYSFSPGSESKADALSVLVKTPGIDWEYQSDRLPLKGRISGTLRAEGRSTDPRVSADVDIRTGKLLGPGIVSGSASGRLKITASRAAAEIAVTAASLTGFSIAVSSGKSFSFKRVDLAGTAGLRLIGRPSARADLRIRFPGLLPVRLAGRLGLSPFRLYQATLDSPGQKVAALRGLLAPFLPSPLGGWAADGTVDISVRADEDNPQNAGKRYQADITISGGKFNDPHYLIASEGLHSRISFLGDFRAGSRDFEGKATIELLRGESLWQRFYISWDRLPLRAALSGRFDRRAGSLEGLAAQVFISGLGEVRAEGRLSLAAPMTFDLRAGSRLALDAALPLFSMPRPSSQGGLRIRGEASTDLKVGKSSRGLAVKGRLTLADVSVEARSSGFSIPSLSAELPIDLDLSRMAGAPPAAAGGGTGAVRIGKIRTPRFELEVPPLSVTGSRNAYEISPVALDVFGGRLEFGKTALALTTGPTISLSGTSSLRLTEIGLSGLPFVPAGSPLRGTVRANFPALDITLGKIGASGQAEADVFGGQVIVTDLAVLDPFVREREISCDVELRDLDLKMVTDLVPFGEVTGIIRGQVRDLLIAYGQPEQFTLSLESVERKGAPQTFSLKAVNSLTVITAGRQATAGTGPFWLRFIKGFRYDKIGIRSTLKNDMFTIDGTINENGVEYLVKRPPLFGISVVNRNPGKSIGFKDMMSRLKRVGQSGAPDIK